MLENFKNIKGITLIALIITVIILLILAGVTIITLTGENGLLERAKKATEETKHAEAKESLQLMLLDIKTKVISEENREPLLSDCEELEDRKDIIQIKYVSNETEGTNITEVNNPQYALIEYKKYIFKIDNQLNIIDGNDSVNDDNNEEENAELREYKEKIAQTITELGVKTEYTQDSEGYIKNIKILAEKNYNEGKDSNIVLLKSNLSSRYTQTLSLTSIDGYENFDEEDFIIVNKNMLWTNTNDREMIHEITKFYDKQTGILTLGKQKDYASKNSWTFWNTYDLYAIKRNIKEVKIDDIPSNNAKETLNEFKNKLAKIIEEYGIENSEENPIIDKTAKEISEYIKTIARNKFEDGVATYRILIQSDLSSRYNQTVSVTNIGNYNNLTIEDFLIVNKNLNYIMVNDKQEIGIMTKAYNQDTGTLEFGKQKSYSDVWTFWNTYDVYLLKKGVINLET